MDERLEPGERRFVAEHRLAQRVRFTPRSPVVSGNAASIAATSAPPGPWSLWTVRVGVEHRHARREHRATVDLPMPIDPVRPTVIN
jgi:hypothetical protein